MSTSAILYLYLEHGIHVPLSTPAKMALRQQALPFHDLDISSDSLTWHYTQQWIEEHDDIMLMIDGQAPTSPEELKIADFKKTVSRLLKYKRKIHVIYLESSQESAYWPLCKPFDRLLTTKTVELVSDIEF